MSTLIILFAVIAAASGVAMLYTPALWQETSSILSAKAENIH